MVRFDKSNGNGEPGRRRPTKAQVAYATGKIDAALAMIEARLRPPPPNPPQIWAFDVFCTWSRVADPIHWPDGGFSDSEREALYASAGYHPLPAMFGEKFALFTVELFAHETAGYLAEIIVAERLEHVLLPDFPALLAFLRLVAPI